MQLGELMVQNEFSYISWFKQLIIKYANGGENMNVNMSIQAVSDIIRLMFLYFYGLLLIFI